MREVESTSAAARHELLLLRLMTLTRVVVLAGAASSLVLHWHALRYPTAVLGLLAMLVLESAVLVFFHIRRGALNSRCLAALDVCLGMAALVVVVTLLKPSANPDTDNVLYPYTVTTLSLIGLVYRRLPASVIAAAMASALYVSATAWRFGAGGLTTLISNATTYWAWAVAGWFLANRFRGLSAELDEARRTAGRQEAELARERERSRHARELHTVRMASARRELEQARERARLSRALHDHVLQTLEFMGRNEWISDPMVRDHVAAEAAWLRALVLGELDGGAGALSAALDRAVERQTRAGMRIELSTSGLGAETVPRDMIDALAGAVTELLTNVRKHAGTDRAVVRAIAAHGRVSVTVLDHGRGFDPVRIAGGVGLRESVIARMREAGGHVAVRSKPGTGTHVEMTVPMSALKDGADAPAVVS